MDRVTALSRPFPSSWVEWAIRHKEPYLIKRFSLRHTSVCFVGVPLTSRQMKTLPRAFVLNRLVQACRKAERLGADILSLGGYTAIASDQGSDLAGKTGIGLTTGRAYTVHVVMEQVKPYLKKGCTVAIVGAQGAIGSACTSLAKKHKQYKVIQVGRQNISQVYAADIVITATSEPGAIINPDLLKPGCVVCDAAKPSNLRPSDRTDITVIPGGLVRLPEEVDFGFDFDCPKNTVYACMAEPMILALEGRKGNYCIGKEIGLGMVEEIGRLGKKQGFEVLG